VTSNSDSNQIRRKIIEAWYGHLSISIPIALSQSLYCVIMVQCSGRGWAVPYRSFRGPSPSFTMGSRQFSAEYCVSRIALANTRIGLPRSCFLIWKLVIVRGAPQGCCSLISRMHDLLLGTHRRKSAFIPNTAMLPNTRTWTAECTAGAQSGIRYRYRCDPTSRECIQQHQIDICEVVDCLARRSRKGSCKRSCKRSRMAVKSSELSSPNLHATSRKKKTKDPEEARRDDSQGGGNSGAGR
jgi:hypothetical protein